MYNITIIGKANFQGSLFDGYADFRESRFNKTACFNYSIFNQSDFKLSEFNQTARFDNSQFNQEADFSKSQFNLDANFSNSRFKQAAYFRDSIFNKSAIFKMSKFDMDSSFSKSNLSSVDFNGAIFTGDLYLDGSKIDNLSLVRAEFSKIFMRWKDINMGTFDETAYLKLIGNFRNLNLLDDANDCYYDYRNDRRETLRGYKQPMDFLLMLFYGYGVKPDRAVLSSLFFVALFASIFWWRQSILPVREGEPEAEANRFTLTEAVVFSGMTFLSGGKLVFDPPEYRIAPGKTWHDVQTCKGLYVWERLIGMLLIIMFGIAVTKTIILS